MGLLRGPRFSREKAYKCAMHCCLFNIPSNSALFVLVLLGVHQTFLPCAALAESTVVRFFAADYIRDGQAHRQIDGFFHENLVRGSLLEKPQVKEGQQSESRGTKGSSAPEASSSKSRRAPEQKARQVNVQPDYHKARQAPQNEWDVGDYAKPR